MMSNQERGRRVQCSDRLVAKRNRLLLTMPLCVAVVGCYGDALQKSLRQSEVQAARCAAVLPRTPPDGAHNRDGSSPLLDLEHDVGMRLSASLGAITVPMPAVSEDLSEAIKALNEVTPSQENTGGGKKKFRTELVGSVTTTANAAKLLASHLSRGLPPRVGGANVDERNRNYSSNLQVLARNIGGCLKEPSCSAALLTLSTEIEKHEKLNEEFESSHAAYISKPGGVGDKERGELEKLTVTWRAYHQWMAKAAELTKAIAGNSPDAFIRGMAERESGRAARFALKAVRRQVMVLNRRLEQLDSQLYGGLSLASVIFGPSIDKATQRASEEVGGSAARLLCGMRISPEALLAESCRMMSTDESVGMIDIAPIYNGLVEGISRQGACASAPPSSPAQTVPLAAAQRSLENANRCSGGLRQAPSRLESELLLSAQVGEWKAYVAHHQGYAMRPAPPTRPSSGMEDAFMVAILRTAGLLDGARGGYDPHVENTILSVASTVVHEQGPDTALISELKDLVRSQRMLEAQYAEMVKDIRENQHTYHTAQVMNSICAVLDEENPHLVHNEVPARCLGRTVGNPVGAIEVGKATQIFAPAIWGSRHAFTGRGKQKDQRQIAARQEKLTDGLVYISRAIAEGTKSRKIQLRLEVEGFSSAERYDCETMLADLTGLATAGGLNPELPICEGPPTDSKVDCFVANGDGFVVALPGSISMAQRGEDGIQECLDKRGDANAVLATLRARTVLNSLKQELSLRPQAEGWEFGLRPARRQNRPGANNQRFRIFLTQK